MRLALNRHYIERANGAARGLLWLAFCASVITATIYDLGYLIVW
jgi:hypothetical protein